MLDHATASFTASSAAHAAGIGCTGSRHLVKAHTLRLSTAAILTAARAGREHHVQFLPTVHRINSMRQSTPSWMHVGTVDL